MGNSIYSNTEAASSSDESELDSDINKYYADSDDDTNDSDLNIHHKNDDESSYGIPKNTSNSANFSPVGNMGCNTVVIGTDVPNISRWHQNRSVTKNTPLPSSRLRSIATDTTTPFKDIDGIVNSNAGIINNMSIKIEVNCEENSEYITNGARTRIETVLKNNTVYVDSYFYVSVDSNKDLYAIIDCNISFTGCFAFKLNSSPRAKIAAKVCTIMKQMHDMYVNNTNNLGLQQTNKRSLDKLETVDIAGLYKHLVQIDNIDDNILCEKYSIISCKSKSKTTPPNIDTDNFSPSEEIDFSYTKDTLSDIDLSNKDIQSEAFVTPNNTIFDMLKTAISKLREEDCDTENDFTYKKYYDKTTPQKQLDNMGKKSVSCEDLTRLDNKRTENKNGTNILYSPPKTNVGIRNRKICMVGTPILSPYSSPQILKHLVVTPFVEKKTYVNNIMSPSDNLSLNRPNCSTSSMAETSPTIYGIQTPELETSESNEFNKITNIHKKEYQMLQNTNTTQSTIPATDTITGEAFHQNITNSNDELIFFVIPASYLLFMTVLTNHYYTLK